MTTDVKEAPTRRTASPPPPTPPPRPSPASGRKSQTAKAEKWSGYRDSVGGFLQIAGFGLGMAKMHADAAAVAVHGENIANAAADLALEDERVAAILDKLSEIGPYGALLTAVAPLAVQIAVNHGAIPAGVMGTVEPKELVDALVSAQQEQSKGEGEKRNGSSAPASV